MQYLASVAVKQGVQRRNLRIVQREEMADSKSNQARKPSVSEVVKQMVKEMDNNGFYEASEQEAASQEDWFELVITFCKGNGESDETHLRKPWSEFQRVHYLLLTDEFGCNDNVKQQLPALPRAGVPSPGPLAQQLTDYLQRLLALPEVVRSQLFSGFLDEQHSFQGRDASTVEGAGPVTAIDFLVQPFEYSTVYIARRNSHCREVPVLQGESIVWKFEVGDWLDIDFSAQFMPGELKPKLYLLEGDRAQSPVPLLNRAASPVRTGAGHHADTTTPPPPEVVHRSTRYSSGGGRAVQGSFTCPADGRCILKWDNAYSRLRGKRLSFIVESVTPSTMRAATEAADAAVEKARVVRSPAAQRVLDSAFGDLTVQVTAVDRSSHTDSPLPATAPDSSIDIAASPDTGRRIGLGSIHRLPLAATGLLFSYLWPAAPAAPEQAPAQTSSGPEGQEPESGSTEIRDNTTAGTPAGATTSGPPSPAPPPPPEQQRAQYQKDVGIFVDRFEKLEDELAVTSARRAQSDAQAKVLLAKLQRADTDQHRLERQLQETSTQLVASQDKAARLFAEKSAAATALTETQEKLTALDEQLLKVRRERDLLQAERNVWQVARSGMQSELAKVVSQFELEKQAHEDTQRALARSQETCHRLETENEVLQSKLAARGDERGLERAQEEARVAREEALDLRTALSEMEAEVAKLNAHKRVLVAELRVQTRTLTDAVTGAQAEAEEARMMQRSLGDRLQALEKERGSFTAMQAENEVRLSRLKAEKRVLVAEVQKARKSSRDGGVLDLEAPVLALLSSGLSSPDGDHPARNFNLPADGRQAGDAGSGRPGPGAESSAQSAGSTSPPPPAVNNRDVIKVLSRQLVHLRSQKHDLREMEELDPSSARQRSGPDIDRAIAKLELQIKKLMGADAAASGH